MSVRKAVIPVAGFATRFLPACKSLPKCMLTILDKPIIQYLVDEAVASGIEEILLVVGRKKEIVEDYFSKDEELEEFLKERGKESFIPQVTNLSGKAKIHFIVEEGGAKGLGHAIYMAKDFVGNEPFAIMYGDVIMQGDKPCLKEIIEQHEKLGSSVIGVERVDWKDVPKYGNVSGEAVTDRLYKVEKMQEKPKVEETKSNLAISDRHVLMPDLFDFLEKTKPGKGGEIQVTDAYNSMVNTKEGVYAYLYEAKRFDSGDKLGFVKASVDETLRRPELRDDLIKFIKSLDI
jgi:UTP--glucose-1-phosphate uridylyltransferase